MQQRSHKIFASKDAAKPREPTVAKGFDYKALQWTDLPQPSEPKQALLAPQAEPADEYADTVAA